MLRDLLFCDLIKNALLIDSISLLSEPCLSLSMNPVWSLQASQHNWTLAAEAGVTMPMGWLNSNTGQEVEVDDQLTVI